MRSLEDLERAFERGLNAWESGKVLTVAGRMGQKCGREVQAENASHNGQPETALALIGRKAGE